MNSLIKNSLFHVVITLCLLLVPVSGFSQDRIKAGAFYYPPFYMEENGGIQGIGVELVNELFGRMNIGTEIKLYPIKRALNYLEKGKIDVVMILIKTPEREKYLYYTEPVMTAKGFIWSAADRKEGPVEFEKFEDLKPYKIGVTLGYSYGNEFDNILKTFKHVDTANQDLHNYRKLMRHRIEIFPGNEIVAKGLFKKYPELYGKFVHSQKAFMEWELHMGISKKSRLASQLADINKVLSDLKSKGFVDKIVEKYTR